MWRCRRGTQLMGLGTSVLAVGIIILRALWSTEVSRPSTELQLMNTTAFLNNLHHMSLEPVKTRETCQNSKVDVLIIVPSSVANYEARQAVRQSWGANLPPSWPLVFYVGATTNSSLKALLTAEANQHDDIAQDSSFHDSYSNLTLKTLSLLMWAQKFCKNATFTLKTDDDVFINIKKMHYLTVCVSEARQNTYGRERQDNSQDSAMWGTDPTTQLSKESPQKNSCNRFKPKQYVNYFINSLSHEYESYMFGGYLYNRVKADRDPHSKWYLDPKVYAGDILPPFLSGTAYIMTSNIIPHLLEEAKHRPLIELEDVYISGLVAGNGLKLKLSHLEGWSRFRPWWDSPCIYKELLTAHGLSPFELSTMTKNVNDINHTVCDSFTVKLTNTLNSLLSSILPRLPTKNKS